MNKLGMTSTTRNRYSVIHLTATKKSKKNSNILQ